MVRFSVTAAELSSRVIRFWAAKFWAALAVTRGISGGCGVSSVDG